ncbi:MAG: GtrA family protein [Anaerolineae bacterium]|nr:GtrA family protein [Anaerolineae bacterium]
MVSSETETPQHELQSATKASWLAYPFNVWNQIILKIAGRTGGAKAKEVERFLKFATVGIIGAIIDFGVLNLLQATVLSPTDPHGWAKVALATSAAFVAAVASNFIWNRYWTYPDSRSRPIQQQLAQFFLVSLSGWTFRLLWVSTLYGPLGNFGADALQTLGLTDGLDATATKKLGTNFAQFFAVWIVMVWNFFVNRYWTYNDVE